jgi:hypothetical protein
VSANKCVYSAGQGSLRITWQYTKTCPGLSGPTLPSQPVVMWLPLLLLLLPRCELAACSLVQRSRRSPASRTRLNAASVSPENMWGVVA